MTMMRASTPFVSLVLLVVLLLSPGSGPAGDNKGEGHLGLTGFGIQFAAAGATERPTPAPCVPNAATNTTCPPQEKPPLTWQGIVVLSTVVIMIGAMAAGFVGSTPALFLTTMFYFLLGVIDKKEVFAGLVNKGMLTIALLFPVVHPLSHLPLMQKLTNKLIETKPGGSPYFALFKLCLFGWATSPFLENVPHVALLTPIVAKKCREMNIPPAQMLMSMTFTIVSSNWMLLASASNLIMAGLQEDSGETPLGFFELAKTNAWVSLLLIPYMIFAPKYAFKSIRLGKSGGGGAGGGGSPSGVVKRSHEFTTTMTVPIGNKWIGQSVGAVFAQLPPKVSNSVAIKEVHRTPDDNSSSGGDIDDAAITAGPHRAVVQVDADSAVADATTTSTAYRTGGGVSQRRRTTTGEEQPASPAYSMPNTPPPEASESSPSFTALGGNDDGDEEMMTSLHHHRRSFRVGQKHHYSPLRQPHHRGSTPPRANVTVMLEPGNDLILHQKDELVCTGTVSEMRAFRNLLDFQWVAVAGAMEALQKEMDSGGTEPTVLGSDEHLDLRDPPATTTTSGSDVAAGSASSAVAATSSADGGSATGGTAAPPPMEKDPRKTYVARFEAAKHYGTVAVVPQVSTRNATFVTVVLSHSCAAVGTQLIEGKFNNKYRATIVAIRAVSDGRDVYGEDIADYELEAGDTLLLRTDPSFSDSWGKSPDFYLVEVLGNALDDSIQHHFVAVPSWIPLGTTLRARGGKRYLQLPTWYSNLALVVFLGVIAAAMADVYAPIAAGLGIICLVSLGLVTVKEAVSYVDWNVYIAGAFAFGTGYAMTNSGLAAWIGQLLVESGVGGMLLLLILHIVTGLLANVISNRGAIQVMYPIVVVLFRAQGLDLTPAAVTIANASMAGFLTPYGLSPSLVIAGPGGYESKHFLLFGTPLFILYALLSAFATSLVYNFW